MLSDEEKEALEILKSFEPDDLVECAIYLQALERMTNLIEKQQKEIEELKVHQITFTNDYKPIGSKGKKFISEDKIKAKIKELEKELEDIELKNINKDEISKTTFYFIDRLKCKIEVLQSLLEKE